MNHFLRFTLAAEHRRDLMRNHRFDHRVALSLILTLAVLSVPFLQKAFSFAHISLLEYGIALVLAFLIIPLVEVVKAIQRAVGKKK